MSETYTLVKPLKTAKGDLTTITLSRPTARLFQLYGRPFGVTRALSESGAQTFTPEYNDKALIGFLSDMAGVDPIAFEDIDAYDYEQLADRLWALVKNPPKPLA